MSLARNVLLVSPTGALSKVLARTIRNAGHRVTVVKTFKAAKARLTDPPALLITELKLGEYNGLHLAVRSRTTGVPAIVVADKSFEQDAEQLGAVWLSPESAVGDELQAMMTRLLQGPDSIHAVYPWFEETPSERPTPEVDDFGDSTAPRVLH